MINAPKKFSENKGIVVEINGPSHFNGNNELNAKTKIKEHCIKKIYNCDGTIKSQNNLISFQIPKFPGIFRDGIHSILRDEYRNNLVIKKKVEENFNKYVSVKINDDLSEE